MEGDEEDSTPSEIINCKGSDNIKAAPNIPIATNAPLFVFRDWEIRHVALRANRWNSSGMGLKAIIEDMQRAPHSVPNDLNLVDRFGKDLVRINEVLMDLESDKCLYA